MRRTPIRSSIRPKISTMPRQQSEAAAYLDIYKLVVEKKRLQQELDGIEQRRGQIGDRLSTINAQINDLEDKAHQIQNDQDSDKNKQPPHDQSSSSALSNQTGQFKTITLEY